MVLNVVAPIFLIILVGAIIGHFKKFKLDPFVNLIIYITAPALIIDFITKSQIEFSEFMLIFGIAAIIVIIMVILAYFAL